MTPQFTTPCYVQVDDKDKRKEICEQLERIGYEMSELTRKYLEKIPEFFQVSTSCRSRQIHVTSELGSVHKVVGRVDCGINTELFLAIAGIRSDTDKGQWFVSLGPNGMWRQFGNETPTHRWRRATATEILEHFNNK